MEDIAITKGLCFTVRMEALERRRRNKELDKSQLLKETMAALRGTGVLAVQGIQIQC
jgi:hypothetical protein